MDEKMKTSCPNCCQLYSFNTLAAELNLNIPLFLKCGHTMCECCVRNIVKSAEHIQCKICLRQMEINTTNVTKLLQSKKQLYKMFPVSLSTLGELALDLIKDKSEIKDKKPEDYFIDLGAILDTSVTNEIQGECLECHSRTTKMCQQCATVICENCFSKSHKSFVVFKNHVLQNIEQKTTKNYCKVHSQKSLEYYCKDCTKSICMDCLMVGSEKSCKNHDVVSTVEMNEVILSDLYEIYPQVDITFRRMTKTAVDIGHLLKDMDNNSESPELLQVVATIDQHFSKLYAMVQRHKEEVMNNVARLRGIERESLLKAREDVESAIKESYKVMNALKLALDSENKQSTNLSALLEEAKNVVNKPWSLSKIESNEDPIKVCVSEEICLLVSDYVQLVGNAQARYALCAADEAASPPPIDPVFPPDMRHGTDSGLNMATSSANSPPRRDKVEPVVSSPPNETPSRPNPKTKKPANQADMTYDENKPSIELKAGVQELALITNMRSPHDFYVRRARDEPLLCVVEAQLRESLGAVPRGVDVGTVYAVNHEHSWKRARIDAANDVTSTYCSTFVDYGYSMTVSGNELREIPARLAGGEDTPLPGPLALRCRLANCKPIDGAWVPADVDLVRRMVDRSPVLLHVRRSGAVNECDVTTRDGVSVAHALSFHSRALLVDLLLPYPEANPADAPPQLPPANAARLRATGRGPVLVTHVVTPAKFYVRETCLQSEYLKLCEDLNKAYESDDGSGYIYLPKSGSVCVVQVSPEQQCEFVGWARAIVTSAPHSEACGVWLPDCGRRLLVPWHRLRVIQPRFTVLKALAIKGHLFGVTPASGRWPDGAARLLARRRQLLAVVCDERPSLGVVLLDLTTPAHPVCVNQEIVDSGFAAGTGVDFQALTAEYSAEKGPTPQPVPVTANCTENGKTNELKEATMSRVSQVDLPTEGQGSLKLQAKILHYESPSLFYIALVHQQKQFYDLFEDIQKFYLKRKTPRREKWKVNDRTCAFCTQSQTWRRATITNIEKDQVTVFYTDFAQTETISISDLKRLHSDFEMIGNAAIKCHLASILPAGGEWPSLTKEFLKDKLDEYPRLFVTRVGHFVDTSMPVELWVYHTERGSALEPDRSEWRCLNKELVARGLAVPHPDCTQQNGNASGSTDDDTVSFLNVRGSIAAWLLPPPPQPDSGSGSSDGHHEPFVTHWLPPEPLQAEEFTAVPTYIDNDAIIYLHDVAQQDDLDFIRDTLEMAFKEPDPRAQFCTWRVGELCVAKYYLDGHFYRGIVEEVNVDQSNCLVQYVDYGNSEICTFEDLRKRIALHQIPIQAHKCCLSRIKPVSDRWSQDVLDYVHKTIVEKKCFVKVVGPPVDGVTPIDLKYDKLWFNDHLVEFDLAVYIDGSKPLTRQYMPKTKPTTHKNKRNAQTTDEVAENAVIKVDCSSEPDYIVEEDIESSEASGSPDSFKVHTLVDRDNTASETVEIAAELAKYPRYEERDFTCNIPVINETDCLELSIIRDPEFNQIYEELFEAVKEEGGKMPQLNGVFEYKPCIALFEGTWYRACILKYSEAKNLIKVHYVDYGNIGIVPLSETREINSDWARIPPVCMTVRLHGITVNPNLHPDEVTEAYINTFLEKGPFNAKIINYDNSLPLVELRNSKGELVYQKLIDENVFLYEACDNVTVN